MKVIAIFPFQTMTQNEERSLLLPKKRATFLGCCRSYKFVSIHSKGGQIALLLASMFGFNTFQLVGKEMVKPYVKSISHCLVCLMFPNLGLICWCALWRVQDFSSSCNSSCVSFCDCTALEVVGNHLRWALYSVWNHWYCFYHTPVHQRSCLNYFLNHHLYLWPRSTSWCPQFWTKRVYTLEIVCIRIYRLDKVHTVRCMPRCVEHCKPGCISSVTSFLPSPSFILSSVALLAATSHKSTTFNCTSSSLCCEKQSAQAKKCIYLLAGRTTFLARCWKKKFRGPFTEEQVEDVKSVFRLVPPLLVATTVNIITMYCPSQPE